MKPAAHVLIFAGSIMALGAMAYASFVLPARETSERKGDVATWITSNVWGHPLTASIITYGGPTRFKLSEIGPYPHFVRQGRWIISTHSELGWTGVEIWYIDGREVTKEEWTHRK